MRCCEICGRESTGRLVLVERGEVRKRKRGIAIEAHTYAYLCESHEQAVKDGDGWQEREEQARKDREAQLAERLVRNQTELF